MGMVVRTNMAALGANNALGKAQKAQQSGMQKLYTGLKINSAKDDASGLAITEKMKNQIKALDS
jgi:flagellin